MKYFTTAEKWIHYFLYHLQCTKLQKCAQLQDNFQLRKRVSVSETTTSNLMFQTICCNNLSWKKINKAGIVWIISLPGRSL